MSAKPAKLGDAAWKPVDLKLSSFIARMCYGEFRGLARSRIPEQREVLPVRRPMRVSKLAPVSQRRRRPKRPSDPADSNRGEGDSQYHSKAIVRALDVL